MQSIPSIVPRSATNAYLYAFYQQLVPNGQAVYVDNQAILASVSGNCFNNVAEYQRLHGGVIQYGWCLWETPGLILQAEFHAVWQNELGSLIDITPHGQALKNGQILFLRDDHRRYEGIRINNQRIALLDDPIVDAYLSAQDALFAETVHYTNDQRALLDTDSQRQEAIQQVNSVLTAYRDSHHALERLIKKIFPRNSSCPCGSGLKAKKCCYI